MINETEYLKRLNMVEFLSRNYGTQFRPQGDGYVCLSPFTDESKPSFHVRRAADGHWLFKDFSSGYGGSIIDFVLLKERLNSASEAAAHLRTLFGQAALPVRNGSALSKSEAAPSESVPERIRFADRPSGRYDIDQLYRWMQGNDTTVCREYLLSRGIGEAFIRQLEGEGLLLHNIHQGKSFCSFAVKDGRRQLRCIDNHQIPDPGGDNGKKFVLGQKHPFSLDWPAFGESPSTSSGQGSQVHICESIIDYLSLKTLEGAACQGIALLGNSLGSYDLGFLRRASALVSCFDFDVGGFRGYLDLVERYPDKEIAVYELQPGQKDINERLLAEKQAQRAARLTAEDKLAIYKAFISSENKSQLSQDWDIDRSYLYKIVNECEEMLLQDFKARRPGRKPSVEPGSKQRLQELEEENRRLTKEKELLYARSEFLQLRLKWSEHEVAELRGEPREMFAIQRGGVPENKPQAQPARRQIKKKKKKRR